MKLKINKNTVFKRQPLQSSALSESEKFNVEAGNSFDIESYQKVGSHFHVLFDQPLGEERQWYVYENHASIVGKNDFLSKIVRAQEKLGQYVFSNPGEVNIVYVEGIDLDGKVNSDRMNQWNDVRLCYSIENREPKLLGKWLATSEPGWKYTAKPLNPRGAFRIALGQYKAWVVGQHRDHQGLVQLWRPGKILKTGLRVGEVRGHRDRNKDGFRTGDPIVVRTGIGINQHHGWDMIRVDGASAGCLVGKSRKDHAEFMRIVKSDSRYKANLNYVFWTSILDGSKLES